jgi:hypothetical protein
MNQEKQLALIRKTNNNIQERVRRAWRLRRFAPNEAERQRIARQIIVPLTSLVERLYLQELRLINRLLRRNGIRQGAPATMFRRNAGNIGAANWLVAKAKAQVRYNSQGILRNQLRNKLRNQGLSSELISKILKNAYPNKNAFKLHNHVRN